jgi:hypothetical protein
MDRVVINNLLEYGPLDYYKLYETVGCSTEEYIDVLSSLFREGTICLTTLGRVAITLKGLLVYG